jgi:tetrahedral aminopeptidase
MYLKQLSEAIGISGAEDQVRALVLGAVRGHVDEARIDALGNVIVCKRGGQPGSMPVLLGAHMDEIGLMVVGHDGEGYLRVRPVGGIDTRLLPGVLLQVGPERIAGVIGLKPVHLLEDDEEERIPRIEQLAVDIGAKSKEEAAKLAPLGTLCAFGTCYRELGPTVSGKAFDDRAGCAVLIELLLSEPFPCDLYGVFTVQEEVGLRGARVAAFAVEPACAFVLEGTIADDLPKDKESSPTTMLGKGPAITVMDRSFIADRRLVQLLTGTGDALGIPYQIKQPGIGGTDAGAIHAVREGVPSVAVAVPCRYIHSPVSMLNLDDFNHTVRLMSESLARLSPQTLRRD